MLLILKVVAAINNAIQFPKKIESTIENKEVVKDENTQDRQLADKLITLLNKLI